MDVSIGEYKCKAGVFIAAVGVSFNGSHTGAERHLNAVQTASVSARVGLRAAIANDTGSRRHPRFARRVLYLGLCLCFIKSIMQMRENKGEA